MGKSPAQLRQLDMSHVEIRLAHALRIAGARAEAIRAQRKAARHRQLYCGIKLQAGN
jgi:hypothetical protein